MTGLATTKMSSKGQVVIPEEIRKRLGLKAGSQFVVVGERQFHLLRWRTSMTLSLKLDGKAGLLV